jgi:hypothetical protein
LHWIIFRHFSYLRVNALQLHCKYNRLVMIKEIFNLGVIMILAKRKDSKSVKVMSSDSVFLIWDCVKMKLTFIFANKLTEITVYFFRFKPVIRSPESNSYITLNHNDFSVLSTIWCSSKNTASCPGVEVKWICCIHQTWVGSCLRTEERKQILCPKR